MLNDSRGLKPLYWVGSSKKDLQEMPGEVQDVFGYALYLAQAGRRSEHAKPLRGFGSAGVLEVAEDWHGDTYRAVYTVRMPSMSCIASRRRQKRPAGRMSIWPQYVTGICPGSSTDDQEAIFQCVGCD